MLPTPPSGSLVVSSGSRGAVGVVAMLVILGVVAILSLMAGAWIEALIAAAICGFAAWQTSDSLTALLRWRSPELILPANALVLDEPVTLVYRRAARKPVDVSRAEITYVLSCEERVTYTRGTSSHTDTAEVFRQSLVAEVEGTAWGIEALLPIQVPTDAGAPTFDLGHNEVRWTVVARGDGAAVPSDRHSFDVVVAPVLDSMPRSRVQDS